MNDTYTVQEVAEILGVTVKTVTRYCQDGFLSFYRIGRGRYYIEKSSVEKLLKTSRTESKLTNQNYNLNKEKEI